MSRSAVQFSMHLIFIDLLNVILLIYSQTQQHKSPIRIRINVTMQFLMNELRILYFRIYHELIQSIVKVNIALSV